MTSVERTVARFRTGAAAAVLAAVVSCGGLEALMQPRLEQVSQIAGAPSSMCAASVVGEVVCWGTASFDCSTMVPSASGGDCNVYVSPVSVATIPHLTELVVGRGAACALTSSGRAYCWGRNDNGELAPRNVALQGAASPRLLELDRPVVSLATASGVGTCVAYTTGDAACWGGRFPSAVPTRILGRQIVALELVGRGVCTLSGNGEVYCIEDAAAPTVAPTKVQFGRAVKKLSGSHYALCAVLEGDAGECVPYPWGPEATRAIGQRMELYGSWRDARDVSVENSHVCTVTTSGEVRCWGRSTSGAFGVEDEGVSRAEFSAPITIPGIEHARHVEHAGGGVCVLLQSGRVSCFGLCGFGQCGRGHAPSTSRAQEVHAVVSRDDAIMPRALE